ncbi:MAG: hypothetical protein LRS46_03240 [Desulfurococcales archaeon]|nr:hypothetical protein [Desulfurococcales archaeon]
MISITLRRENNAGQRLRLKNRLISGLIGIVGYILSPLSWWNDAFVNIPIAIAFAYILSKLIGLSMEIGFAIGYWLTNIVGIIMLVTGGYGAAKGGTSKKELVIGLIGGTIYTIVALIAIGTLKALIHINNH